MARMLLVTLALLVGCSENASNVRPQTPSQNINTAPNIAVPSEVNFPENSTSVIVSVDSEDAERDTLSFSVEGSNDGGLFEISSSGELTFRSTPNFEQPFDADRDNIYQVTVTVSDGSLSSSASLQITVLDVFEDGTVPFEIVTASLSGSVRDFPNKTPISIISDTNGDGRAEYSIIWNQANQLGCATQNFVEIRDIANLADHPNSNPPSLQPIGSSFYGGIGYPNIFQFEAASDLDIDPDVGSDLMLQIGCGTHTAERFLSLIMVDQSISPQPFEAMLVSDGGDDVGRTIYLLTQEHLETTGSLRLRDEVQSGRLTAFDLNPSFPGDFSVSLGADFNGDGQGELIIGDSSSETLPTGDAASMFFVDLSLETTTTMPIDAMSNDRRVFQISGTAVNYSTSSRDLDIRVIADIDGDDASELMIANVFIFGSALVNRATDRLNFDSLVDSNSAFAFANIQTQPFFGDRVFRLEDAILLNDIDGDDVRDLFISESTVFSTAGSGGGLLGSDGAGFIVSGQSLSNQIGREYDVGSAVLDGRATVISAGVGGESIANVGDITEDGFLDLVFSRNFDSSGTQENGFVSFLSGIAMTTSSDGNLDFSDPPAEVPVPTLFRGIDPEFAGAQILSVGDVNGDGRPDFLVTSANPATFNGTSDRISLRLMSGKYVGGLFRPQP